jgi:NAD(P)-dependent dehydrogenase (short-subunit alcohol dehydrogenase family)
VKIDGASAVVTGGASGLGLATARRLASDGAHVVILDLEGSRGAEVAAELGSNIRFVAADVTDTDAVNAALEVAEERGPLRALVHCAGRGGALRIVQKDGTPGSLELYETVVRINLIGTFNVLRLTATRMAAAESIDGERGVCVLTASTAAYEGQIGQVPYASAKGGVVGMTIVAARDLAAREIRVCTIAPGPFDTPILAGLPDKVTTALAEGIPHPRRLGRPDEYAALAAHIIENPMLNGEVIRIDGALRMSPR